MDSSPPIEKVRRCMRARRAGRYSSEIQVELEGE
jgi:hypothetical protein